MKDIIDIGTALSGLRTRIAGMTLLLTGMVIVLVSEIAAGFIKSVIRSN